MIYRNKDLRGLEKLEVIKSILDTLNFPNNLVKRTSNIPVDLLISFIGQDFRGKERVVNFSFIPVIQGVDDIDLLQVISIPDIKLNIENRDKVEKALTLINSKLLLGFYFIGEQQQIVFKYVYVLPNKSLIKKDELKEVLLVYVYMLELYSEYIANIASEKMTLKQVLEEVQNI